MDPFSSIASGAQVVRGKLSFDIGVQLTSVLAPGITVIAEVYFIVMRDSLRSPSKLLVSGGIATIFLSVLILAAGYMVGHIVREVGFFVLGVIERTPPIQRRLQVNQYFDTSNYLDGDAEEEFKDYHQYFKFLDDQYDHLPIDERRSGGTYGSRKQHEQFLYAKMWLRSHGVGFSVDGKEAVVNILASTLIPVLIAGYAISAYREHPWWSILLIPIIVGLFWGLIVNALLNLKKYEHGDSIRYIVFDFYMRKAAAQFENLEAKIPPEEGPGPAV